MKNIYMNKTLFLSLILLISSFSLSLNAQTNKDIAYFDTDKPVTISLANKDITAWDFNANDNKDIELINTRSGYLFTYFTFKVKDPKVKTVVFNHISGDKTINRSFNLKPLASTNPPLQQEIYGDIPSISQSDGFLSQANNAQIQNTEKLNNITPTPVVKNTNTVSKLETSNEVGNIDPVNEVQDPKIENIKYMDPIATKRYVQNLIDNKLYGQARNTFDNLAKQPEINEDWKILTDLRLSKLDGNYQEMVEKANRILAAPISSPETTLAVHIQKAKGLEALGKQKEAEAEFLYIKSYFMDQPESYTQLADFYIRNKQDKKALTELNYIVSQFNSLPNLDKIYYQLGNTYYKTMGANGYTIALSYYKKVLGFGLSSPYYTKAKQLVDFLEKDLLNYQ